MLFFSFGGRANIFPPELFLARADTLKKRIIEDTVYWRSATVNFSAVFMEGHSFQNSIPKNHTHKWAMSILSS